MKRLLVAAVLLTACGPSLIPPAATGAITGTVVAAPCRPVERAGDPPCPPVPGVTVVVGTERAVTDGRGVYHLSLPAGSYEVSVIAGARRVPAEPSRIAVVAGRTATVNLTYDSGIR